MVPMDLVTLVSALLLGVILFAALLGLTSIVEGTAPRESVEHLVSGSARHS
jgi:hypothetical protein